MTENYPPFNYQDKDGNIIGITTEIVKEIQKNTGDDYPIKIMPWARAYKSIINKPNKVLFSMTRTPQREYLFKWVGPIANNTFVFYARSNSKIKINSLDEAKDDKYKIGTYLDGANEQYLKSQDFYNIYSVPDDLLNLKKLIKGRIDLWAAGETQGLYKAKQLKINPDEIKKIYKIKETQLYIAFSRTTPNSLITLWQNELEKNERGW
jgi:polar amino acid transport system substrate-binding protein